MRKRLKSGRIISAIICVLLITALIPAYSFADNGSTKSTPGFNYVALGDGSTSGYGMAPDAGYGVLTKGTYPAVLADQLSAKGLNVNVSQMAARGMRTEELRFLLDDSYAGDTYLKDTFPDLKNLRPEYRSAIRNADLVTYALGTVNFGSYILYIAGDVEKRCSDPQVKALADADADGVKEDIKKTLDEEVAKIPSSAKSAAQAAGYDIDEMVATLTEPYLNAAAYVYYSFCLSYDESIRLIRTMNPDADIIVLGLYNMLGGFAVDVMGVDVNLGDLYNDNVIKRVNDHILNTEGTFAYIGTTDAHRFFNETAEYDDDPAHVTQQFIDYCNIYEDDFHFDVELEKKLKNSKESIRTKAYAMTYDVAAQCLKSVSGVGEESFDVSNMLYAKDNIETITAMGADLMAGIKAEAMSYVDSLIDKGGVFSYKNKLNNFINGARGVREGNLYGKDDNMRKFGRVIMAAGMRVAMGEGYFQQPSTKGHSQLAASIMDSYKDRIKHRSARQATCQYPGNVEFWLNVATGKYYSDAACTQDLTADQAFIPQLDHVLKPVEGTAVDPTCTAAGKEIDQKCENCGQIIEGAPIAALGHNFGKPVFKGGKNISKCSRCGSEQTTVIPVTSIKSLKAAKKAFKVTWKLPSKANLKKITGYEIRYSLKSSMASSKTAKVTKNKTTSKTIKKLKAKKKYYVQIRSYYKSGGYTYYSSWSAKKSVKTK